MPPIDPAALAGQISVSIIAQWGAFGAIFLGVVWLAKWAVTGWMNCLECQLKSERETAAARLAEQIQHTQTMKELRSSMDTNTKVLEYNTRVIEQILGKGKTA